MTTTRDNAVHYNDGYNFYKPLPRIIGRYENSRLVLFSDMSPDSCQTISKILSRQFNKSPSHRRLAEYNDRDFKSDVLSVTVGAA